MVITKPQRPWIVQKYGGTSLGKMLNRICEGIIPISLETGRLVITCSALSSSEKRNGTTSLLLDCIELARKPEDSTASARIATNLATIRDNHVQVLQQNTRGFDGSDLAEIEAEIINDCSEAQGILKAAQQIGEVSPHTQDKVLMLGEKLATKVVAFKLQTQGINAESVLFDNIVEETFGSDVRQQTRAYRQLGQSFYRELAGTIGDRLSRYVDIIPIVGGFFGMMPGSLLDSVGRGYSDVCAAMCASGLQAEELQIWKEVDGVFTADPRVVPSARPLPIVTVQEAAELTFFGSEVIHPLTMSQVQFSGIPMRIKNVLRPLGAGTVIVVSESGSSTPDPDGASSSSLQAANALYQQTPSRPTALTVKRNVMVANLTCNQHAKPSWFLRTIFDQLERHNVVVDLVSVSERNISIAVEEERNARALVELEEHLRQSGQGGMAVVRELSIVSVVGQKMRNTVGIAADMFSALAGVKINIHMISQGASEINIAAVVDTEHALTAMEVIHAQVLKIPTVIETQSSLIRGPWLY